MKKKVNPRYRPSTAAEVQKARKRGQEEALRVAWVVFFMALHDKFGFGAERLTRLWHKIEDISDSISKGYVTVADMEEELGKMGFELIDSRTKEKEGE